MGKKAGTLSSALALSLLALVVDRVVVQLLELEASVTLHEAIALLDQSELGVGHTDAALVLGVLLVEHGPDVELPPTYRVLSDVSVEVALLDELDDLAEALLHSVALLGTCLDVEAAQTLGQLVHGDHGLVELGARDQVALIAHNQDGDLGLQVVLELVDPATHSLDLLVQVLIQPKDHQGR